MRRSELVGPNFSMQIVVMTCACSSRGWCLVGVLTAVTLVLLLAARPAVSAVPPRVQVGLASWYGPGFHGNETASGEIFDQREMVAAHRSLPLGSVVRVTNLENGRRVVLRVIDRGPYGRNYRKGTIIDVSRGAARRLRFIRDGLVEVRVEVLRLGGEAGR
jgi:peptidoglycan lytic transglycosylase